jgi:hypothetical protein
MIGSGAERQYMMESIKNRFKPSWMGYRPEINRAGIQLIRRHGTVACADSYDFRVGMRPLLFLDCRFSNSAAETKHCC